MLNLANPVLPATTPSPAQALSDKLETFLKLVSHVPAAPVSVTSTARQARAQAFQDLGLETEPLPDSLTPLWAVFGWERIEDVVGPWAPNEPEDDYRARMASWLKDYPTACGRGHVGFHQGSSGQEFDLGDAMWRLKDFIQATSQRAFSLELADTSIGLNWDRATGKPGNKAILGDGILGRVHPARVGLPDDCVTALQCRGFIKGDHGKIVWVAKGLLLVDAEYKEVIALADGYGRPELVDVNRHELVIHQMVDARDYNPEGRVAMQSLYYEGVPGWETRFSQSLILNSSSPARDEYQKLLQADMPLRFLGAATTIGLLKAVFDQVVTIKQGHRRKAIPGLAFGRHLARHTFLAPVSLKAHFPRGQEFVVHRDPSMPDGSSAFSAICSGYTSQNAFIVPTAQTQTDTTDTRGCFEQTGGDYDGDDALVLPTRSQGGLLLGFDQRDPLEQQALIAASSFGRKSATYKQYADGRDRWTEQRIAAVKLGIFDTHARKLHDAGMSIQAAALKPFIQVAVDRQKRGYEYPAGLSQIPKVKEACATQIFKSIRSPDAESPDKTDWKHSWNLLRSAAAGIELLTGESPDSEEILMRRELRTAMQPVARWAAGIWRAVCAEIMPADSSTESNWFPAWMRFPVENYKSYLVAQSTQVDRGLNIDESLGLMSDAGRTQGGLLNLRLSDPKRAAGLQEGLITICNQAQADSSLLGVSRFFASQFTDRALSIMTSDMRDLKQFAGMYENTIRVSDLPNVVLVQHRGRWMKLDHMTSVFDGVIAVGDLLLEPGQVQLKASMGATSLLVDGIVTATLAKPLRHGKNEQTVYDALVNQIR
jgi:hypothetical protein